MPFDVPHRKRRGVKPTAPVNIPNPWTTVIIRRTYYAMLRELALYYKQAISETVMKLIDEEFNKILKEVDPENAEKGYHPPLATEPKKRGRPRKYRGRLVQKTLAEDDV
jgi:hypothetical protein